MKRILFTGLLVSVGLLVLGPGAIGLIAERSHDQLVTGLTAQGYQVTTEGYARGWFLSHARLRYAVTDPKLIQLATLLTGETDGTASLLVVSDMHHGPFPALRRGSIRPAWTQVHSELALLSPSGRVMKLPGRLDSRLEADGQSRFRYQAAPGASALRDDLELAWRDIDLSVHLGRDAQTLSVDGTLAGLQVNDGHGAIEVAGLAVSGDQRQLPNGLWSGDMRWQIASLSMPGAEVTELALMTQIDSDLGEAVYRIKADAAEVRSELFDGGAAGIELELKNIDGPALAALLGVLATDRRIDYRDPGVAQWLKRVVAAGPQITLGALTLPTRDAVLQGNAELIVARGTDLSAPGAIANGVEGRAALLLPRKMVQTVAANGPDTFRDAIDLMIQLRLLSAEANRYRIDATLANGLLTLNGVPIPLPF